MMTQGDTIISGVNGPVARSPGQTTAELNAIVTREKRTRRAAPARASRLPVKGGTSVGFTTIRGSPG